MPRDSNGNHSRPLAYQAGTKARANDVNTNEADLSAEISDSLSRSGKGKMLRAIGIDEGGTGASSVADAATMLKLLSYASDQVLTNDDFAQARENLQRILDAVYTPRGGWERFQVINLAGGAAWIFDMPDSASRFRLLVDDPRVPSGNSGLYLRCAAAGQPADAGASDYYQSSWAGNVSVNSTAASGGNTNAFTLAAIGAGGGRLSEAIGSMGEPGTNWRAMSNGHESDGTANYLTRRGAIRAGGGRKSRLFLTAGAVMAAGTAILEVM